jgi:tetratricopeptide (TPR) repeat protein
MHARHGFAAATCGTLLLATSLSAQVSDPSPEAADAAYSSKQYADAIPLYRRIVESGLPQEIRARAQLRIGYATYLLKDRDGARVEWLRVADQFPQEVAYAAEGLLRSSNLAMSAGDYGAALIALTRADDAYVSSAQAAQFAPEILIRMGEVHVHAAEVAKANAARDNDVEATGNTIAAEFAAARRAYEKLQALFPDVANWSNEAAMQLVALDYERALSMGGKTMPDVVDAAGGALARLQTDAVRCPTVLLIRAEALTELGRIDEALEVLGEIQSRFTTSAGQAAGFSQFLAAYCAMRKHDYGEAITGFTQFVQQGKPCFNRIVYEPQALYLIALCQREIGKAAEAEQTLSKVVESYPESYAAQLAGEAITRWHEGSPR